MLATVGIRIHTYIDATYMVVHETDVGLIFFFTVCWMRTITLGIQLFILRISVGLPSICTVQFPHTHVLVCFSYFVPYACALHSLPHCHQRRLTAAWLIMYKCSYSRTDICIYSNFMLVGVLILITFSYFFSTNFSIPRLVGELYLAYRHFVY